MTAEMEWPEDRIPPGTRVVVDETPYPKWEGIVTTMKPTRKPKRGSVWFYDVRSREDQLTYIVEQRFVTAA